MARYKATVEYDGTDLLGFQRQANGLRTAQGEFEAALTRIGWSGAAVMGAGRTDSGVHARGQVVAFDLPWKHGPDALQRALNANLPADIAVSGLEECAADFHPRYAARGRRYRYTVHNGPVRSPLTARYAWHFWPPRLQVEAMQAASQSLIGRHDFAAFGTDPDKGDSTVRNVMRAEWRASPSGEPQVYFDIQADAFLYRMVRSLVGALARVGSGQLSESDFRSILASRDRAQCPPVAPPQGLCLMEVLY